MIMRDYSVPVVHDPLVVLIPEGIGAVCTCGEILAEWEDEPIPLDEIIDAVAGHCD